MSMSTSEGDHPDDTHQHDRRDDHTEDRTAVRPLPGWLAIVLVTATSAAVLVLEILAARLLAPYVGVNLETYTAIIGTILAGIALGAWAGGISADHIDPRGMIPGLLLVGGALAISSIPLVRALGGGGGPGSQGAPSVILAAVGFLPAAAVLSAVPPAVIKLQLRDLGATGATVGSLSAWGTGGAIAGTFVAGYVLVAFAAVTTLIVGTGLSLIVGGVALWFGTGRGSTGALSSTAVLAALSLVGVAAVPSPCGEQTSYYCVSIEADPERRSGRVLVLDDLQHSYVDLADPTHLEFWYVRRIIDAIDTQLPGGPVDAIALGGGGLTVPRWLRATRPGSEQVVLEIDAELVDIVAAELAFRPGDDVAVRTGDGRQAIRTLAANSADVLVGDAFGGRSVPWHLATREFTDQVARVLRPEGRYVVNVIDGADELFLRALAATIREVLPHVAVMRGPSLVDGFAGNAVILASGAPLDPAAWDGARAERGDEGELVDDVDAYLDGALVLTDDFAPVDQLIAGAR